MMNKNSIQTTQSFIKSLILSLFLHLAFGATSYALWHTLKSMPRSNNKLKKGEFLTASVEFIPIKNTQLDSILTPANKSNIYQRKFIAASHERRNTQKLRANANNVEQQAESALPDIIPHPNNQPPEYPEEARLIGLEAVCVMKIYIAPDGSVHNADVQNMSKNCLPVFVREAKKSILAWRFSPHRSGYAVRTIPIQFKLELS